MSFFGNSSFRAKRKQCFSGDPWVLAAGFLATGLTIINIIRAAKQSFTIDEAFSYNRFISPPLVQTWQSYDANNHVLLVLLCRLLVPLFGPSELVLRSPTLLGGVLYLFGMLLLLRRLATEELFFFSYLAVTLNPFILDYLSISRGYGLALGLFVVSLNLIVNSSLKPDRVALPAVLLGLSVASSLVFAVPVVSLIVAATVMSVYSLGESLISPLRLGLIAAFVATIILYPPLQTIGRESLYFGSLTVHEMIRSLYSSSFIHHVWYGEHRALQWSAVAVTIIQWGSLGLAACVVVNHRLDRPGRMILITFSSCICCVVMLHVSLGTLYPYGRTGIYFPVLLIVLITTLTRQTQSTIIRVGVVSLFVLVDLCFIAEWNTRTYDPYAFDSGTKRVVQIMVSRYEMANRENGVAGQVKVGASWIFCETINYYRDTQKLTWMQPLVRGDVNGDNTFYILAPEDAGLIAERNLRVVYDNVKTRQILAERK